VRPVSTGDDPHCWEMHRGTGARTGESERTHAAVAELGATTGGKSVTDETAEVKERAREQVTQGKRGRSENSPGKGDE
jgi:hypothetical protein